MSEDWVKIPFEKAIQKTSKTAKIPRKKFLDSGEFPIISQEQEFVNGYWNIPEDVFCVESPLVVFGDHTQVLKYIDFDFVVGADGVKVLQPIPSLHAKYLYYFLMANPIKSLGYARHYRVLKESFIRFPESIAEQKRIVAILDEAFGAIARAKENTERNLANARELFDSYLNRVFTEKGEGWEESSLGDVVKFQGGSQPPKAVFSKTCQEGYIRLIQIRDYKTDKHAVYIPKERAKRFCNADDIMIGRYGPPLFQILRGIEGAYNVALMKAIPNEETLSKDFLYFFLQNKDIFNYIDRSSSRTAGQTGFKKEVLEAYQIAYPKSKSVQSDIVSTLVTLKSFSETLIGIQQKKLIALDELKQSLLRKAFTGQLTSQAKELELVP